MRAVLSATLAKADFVARLSPILGDDLKVVEGEPAIVAAVAEADVRGGSQTPSVKKPARSSTSSKSN